MLAAAHAAGNIRSFTPQSFAVVLGFLRRQGVVPEAPVVSPTPVEVLLGNYRRYLVSGRSLAPLTLPSYLASAAWLLVETCVDDAAGWPACRPGMWPRSCCASPRSAAPPRSTPSSSVSGPCCAGST